MVEKAGVLGRLFWKERAGADHVLSLPTVTGRMLALSVLDTVTIAPGIRIVRTDSSRFAKQTLGEIEGEDWRALAVERAGEILNGSDEPVEDGDCLLVASTIDSDRINELQSAD
jgi:hypothetical protein